MNIKELVFDVTVTKTYQVVVSNDEGYDMPESPKGLIEMVNDMNYNPYGQLDIVNHNAIDTKVEVTYYEIRENK